MAGKGVLLVLSGFSGAGKGTIVHRLMDKYDAYDLSVSATTRNPRDGEIDGKDYYFITKENFEEKIQQDDLIEYARYCDYYYGTPKSYVMNKLDEGRNVILEIEIQGAMKICEKYPEALLVFVMPPSAEEMKKRLLGRGTETPEIIDARVKRAAEESEGIEQYDYILINDDLEKCVDQLHMLVECQKMKPAANEELIQRIRTEVKELAKGE